MTWPPTENEISLLDLGVAIVLFTKYPHIFNDFGLNRKYIVEQLYYEWKG